MCPILLRTPHLYCLLHPHGHAPSFLRTLHRIAHQGTGSRNQIIEAYGPIACHYNIM